MVKGRDRKKGRFEVEVRNTKRLRQNEARNEDRDGTREDRGTQHRIGQGQDRRQGDGLQVMSQVRRGTRGTVQSGEKVQKSEVGNLDGPGLG